MTHVSNTDHAALDAGFGDLWMKQRSSMLERVRVLELAVLSLRLGCFDDAARAHAHRAARKLAGVAGTFGYRDATELAREAEAAFEGSAPIGSNVVVRLGEIATTLWKQFSKDIDRGAGVSS